MKRTATVERKTRETDIRLSMNIDGSGTSKIDTGIPFLDHMLQLMTAHGFMDLEIAARGDTEIDDHHTVEDLGICLGMAISRALNGKEGIKRYGSATIPMDETLSRVVIDISNRPFFCYRVSLNNKRAGAFDVTLLREFFRALAVNAGINLHIDLLDGEEAHHIAESIFKAFGRALDQATLPEDRLEGQPLSTKGSL
jgi:imidazoleglycerol-phosphate dehydratase